MQSPTDLKGSIAEGMVLSSLVRLGKTVLIPFGNGHGYDFAVDVGDGKMLRVQCKHAHLKAPGSLRFKACSRRGPYKDVADIFAVFSSDTGKVYWIPVKDCGPTAVEIRIADPKNSQKKRIRVASNYEIDKQFTRV